jgi:TonB family protein
VPLPADGSLPATSSVRLEVTVDATGAVTEATVVEGLRPDIDAQVLEAARRMRFEPAERGGVAVPARVRFRFRLRAPVSATASALPPNPYLEDLAPSGPVPSSRRRPRRGTGPSPAGPLPPRPRAPTEGRPPCGRGGSPARPR